MANRRCRSSWGAENAGQENDADRMITRVEDAGHDHTGEHCSDENAGLGS